MKRKFSIILTVLLVVLLTSSTVYAGGNIKLSGSFTAGSLHFDGIMTGIGGYKDDITVQLTGIGIPTVVCTDEAGYKTLGENPAPVSVDRVQFVSTTFITKNGKAPVSLAVAEDELEQIQITGAEGGCHEPECDVTVTEILWTKAIVKVFSGNGTGGPLLLKQIYACDPSEQNGSSLSCTLVFQKSFH